MNNLMMQPSISRVVTWSVGIVAVVSLLISIYALYLSIDEPPFEPLHSITLEFTDEVIHAGELADITLYGCSDAEAIVRAESMWESYLMTSALGPSVSDEVGDGCAEYTFQIPIPSLEPGSWHLAVTLTASDNGRTQVLRINSNAVIVEGNDGSG